MGVVESFGDVSKQGNDFLSLEMPAARKTMPEMEMKPIVNGSERRRHNNRLHEEADEDEDEEIPSSCDCLGLATSCRERFCSVQGLKKYVPVLSWLPRYTLADFRGDFVAGFTVALTVIPQGLALATLANLPPQYGLYTAFMGCFIYAIFGSCKDLTIGPTAIMSIMTGEYVVTGGVAYAVLLTFLSGVIQLLMGLVNLGFIIEFISSPVISGFTSAAAITIASTQLKSLFGMKFDGNTFLETIYNFFGHLYTVRLWDSVLGISSIVLLLVIRHFKDRKFSSDSSIPRKVRKVLEIIWWSLATARNAVMVLASGIMAYILTINNKNVFQLTGDVASGLPSFTVPPFSVDIFDKDTNATIHKNFPEMIKDLGAGIPIIALLSILESVAIAKAFAKGKKLDSTQEMIALGVCNIMGSFVSSYPATGSFSRTAINNSSGVRTTFGGVFTGAIVIMALVFMAPYFYYIPKASLGAIIFTAVIFMVHYQDIPRMWNTNKLDLLPYFATFILSFVLGLEFGIMIGTAISLLVLLFEMSKPKIKTSRKMVTSGIPYLYIQPDRNILFPSSMRLCSRINKSLPDSSEEDPLTFVVIDGLHISCSDYTSCMALKNLSDDLVRQGTTVIFTNLKPSIIKMIRGANPIVFHHCKTEKELEALMSASLANRKSQERRGSASPSGSNMDTISTVMDGHFSRSSSAANDIFDNRSTGDASISKK